MTYDVKAHRAMLRAQGICVRCHKRRAEPDRALCTVCKVERRVTMRRLRARWRNDRERCSVCGAIKPPRFRRCVNCRRINVKARTLAYHKWRDEGRCSGCGATLPDGEGMRYCSYCMERDRKRQLIVRALRG